MPQADGDSLYGKACTTNTDAILGKDQRKELTFNLVEREPTCDLPWKVYPWDDGCENFAENLPLDDHQIKIRVADGATPANYDDQTCPDTNTAKKCTDDGIEISFTHTMSAGSVNPFAPFSHELSVEFTRAFDAAKILFVRHVMVTGSIEEEVPQVWTVATNPTLIFTIIRDPPGGASTATLVELSLIHI